VGGLEHARIGADEMEPSAVGDDLNEVSVLVNVAHRFLLGIRDDVDADPSLQAILDDLNAAHDQLDLALESIGKALEQVDQLSDRPREQRTPIH
jgi:hypothetical protein